MVEIVNLLLCVFHHNKKEQEEKKNMCEQIKQMIKNKTKLERVLLRPGLKNGFGGEKCSICPGSAQQRDF